jgi:hypothetical protein
MWLNTAASHGRPAPDRKQNGSCWYPAAIVAIGCTPAESGSIDPDCSVRFQYHNNPDLSSEK